MKETDRENYTRVTTVLSPFCNFDGIDENVLQKAADRGTRVHECCELHANGEFVMPEADCAPYYDSFSMWYEEMVDKALFTELRLYNDILRITGAIDLVAKLKGSNKHCIIDIKTPQQESKSWCLQLSAYHYLAQGHETIVPERRIALMLSNKGKYPKVLEYTDFNRDWGIFRGILNAYRWFNNV